MPAITPSSADPAGRPPSAGSRHRRLTGPNPRGGQAFAGLTIGLLGGSFNPAHHGHRRVAVEALGRLGLDRVWWLVSPQNPLKTRAGMAAAPVRLARARRVIGRHPRMQACLLESALGTRYTADLARALRRHFPRTRFVWLMGADNLVQIPAWQQWQTIFQALPIAVFAREPYSLKAGGGRAATVFRRHRRPPARLGCRASPPAWAMVGFPLQDISATELRSLGHWPPDAGHDRS